MSKNTHDVVYPHRVTIVTPLYKIEHSIIINAVSVVDAAWLIQKAYPVCKVTDACICRPEDATINDIDFVNASPLTDGENIIDTSVIR